jgi:hypothetical protein
MTSVAVDAEKSSNDETFSRNSKDVDEDRGAVLSETERNRILRKIDVHILPFVSLLYLLSFLFVTFLLPFQVVQFC